MRSAYAAALGRTLIINDGYRDLAGQWDAWNAWQNGTGNLAAYPGTSNHGWAIAADFGGEVYSPGYSSAGHQWLRNNAANYGWWWAGADFSRVESWHWEFNGNYTTTPNKDTEELMLILVSTSASSDGVVKANQAYADNLVGPLVLLSSLEHGALDYWAGRGVPYRRADWSGNDVRNVIRVRGVRPWDVNTGKSTYGTTNY